jgi:hypothetical protein
MTLNFASTVSESGSVPTMTVFSASTILAVLGSTVGVAEGGTGVHKVAVKDLMTADWILGSERSGAQAMMIRTGRKGRRRFNINPPYGCFVLHP